MAVTPVKHMIADVVTIEAKLKNRLRKLRLSWFLRLTAHGCVGFAVSSAGVFVLGEGLTGRVLPGLLCWPALVWGGAILGVILWRRPTLRHVAERFDGLNDNNSRVQNAYELSQGHPDSDFALWAIGDGLRSITKERCGRVFERPRVWQVLLLHLVAIGLGIPWGGSVGGIGSGGLCQRSSEEMGILEKVEGGGMVEVPGRLQSAENEGHSGERDVAGQGLLRGESQGGNEEGEIRRVIAGRANATWGKVRQGEQGLASRGQRRNSSFGLSGERSLDTSSSASSEAFALEPQAGSIASEDFTVGEAESEEEIRDRSHEEGRTRLSSLNLNDTSLPAGRDVASDSGEDDGSEPTESPRGDAQGDKRSKEIAAMLPVLPQIDSISGMLNGGEEARQQTRSESHGGADIGFGMGIAPGRSEPGLPSRHYPRSFRQFINLRNGNE